MIVDDVDQAKFALPHQPFGKGTPKLLESLYRPRMHVTGCWLHGKSLTFAVGHPENSKDANTQVDVISRCLNDAYRDGCSSLPLGLHLQQDNAPNMCNNSKMVFWVLLLMLMKVFRWMGLNYLEPGHTHEVAN